MFVICGYKFNSYYDWVTHLLRCLMHIMKIKIENLNNREVVTAEKSKPLLKHLHAHHIDWLHACGEKGRCTTCKVIVVSGEESLSALSRFEEKYREVGALKNDERLACQVLVDGDIVIRVPEDSKLPHIVYSD